MYECLNPDARTFVKGELKLCVSRLKTLGKVCDCRLSAVRAALKELPKDDRGPIERHYKSAKRVFEKGMLGRKPAHKRGRPIGSKNKVKVPVIPEIPSLDSMPSTFVEDAKVIS